jgi:hypothetical protein
MNRFVMYSTMLPILGQVKLQCYRLASHLFDIFVPRSFISMILASEGWTDRVSAPFRQWFHSGRISRGVIFTPGNMHSASERVSPEFSPPPHLRPSIPGIVDLISLR